MSTFIIISGNSLSVDKFKQRALSLYRGINSDLHAFPPDQFSGNWGTLIYWKGPNERLAEWKISDTGVQLNLGWNSHSSIKPNLLSNAVSLKSIPLSFVPIHSPERSIGIYTIIEADTNAAICIPDPYATYPIYHLIEESISIISNDPVLALSVAGKNLELSEVGIVERLLTEGNLGDSYILKNIPRLKPGEWIVVMNQSTNVLSYKFLPEKITRVDFEALMVSQFRKLGNLNRPIILKLTGGKDTRLNLLFALKAGLRPLCYTIKSIDSLFAQALSEKFGLTHVHVDNLGNPIDPSSIAAQEYQKIKERAVFITGADGALAKAHYQKKSSYGIGAELDSTLNTYLGFRRRALLSEKHYGDCRKKFLNDWNSLLVGNSCWWVNSPSDALYVERVRTFTGEAWAHPSGAVNVPTLSGPLTYGYGAGFSHSQRLKKIPHISLIETIPDFKEIPFLELKPSVLSRIIDVLPSILKAYIHRIVYKFRYKRHRAAQDCFQTTYPILQKFFTREEVQRLCLMRQHYVIQISEIIKRVQRVQER
jgi:hypothetical protein